MFHLAEKNQYFDKIELCLIVENLKINFEVDTGSPITAVSNAYFRNHSQFKFN